MDNGNKCDISKYGELVRESLSKAIEFQQNMYELSSDWNYYEETEHEYLKRNIKYSVCGEYDLEDSEEVSAGKGESESDDVKKKKAELKAQIDTIYNQIVKASRTKKSLYVGIIFNVLCESDEKVLRKRKNEKDKKDQEDKKTEEVKKDKGDDPFGIPVPIFKVRICMDREELRLNSNKNCSTKEKKIGKTALYPHCVSYVDTEGRTYKNWTDYVVNNTLPKCLMVLPMGGFYQENPNASNKLEKTYAWIEIGPSPAVEKIVSYLDVASTVFGVGALGVGIATLAAPIAAPVLIAGSVCGAVSGAYTTVRSSQQLVDRHEHQQSISLTDRTARLAWLGAVGGVAGGVASGSSFVLTKAVKAGVAVGTVGRATYNTIAVGNIVINGLGIGNGLYGIIRNYHEKKEFSVLEIGQVVAHILFFGNAVMKFQTAKTLINNTQQRVLQDYEGSLRSKRHQKAFKRIRRNTQAASGDTMTGDSEIIRGIRSIQNKDDFFAGVVRNRKIFSASKAEVTFKDGYATINDNVKFDPFDLSQQPKDVRVNTVSAAEPFTKVPKSALLQSYKMPESSYFEQLRTVTEILQPLMTVVPVATDGVDYVGRLIIEMQGFTKKDCQELIVKLAKLALRLVKENRCFSSRSLEQIMHWLWRAFVAPQVDKLLENMGINVTEMVKFTGLADLIYDVTRQVIDEMLAAIEGLLEYIVESFSQHLHAEAQTDKDYIVCSVCSGHVMSD